MKAGTLKDCGDQAVLPQGVDRAQKNRWPLWDLPTEVQALELAHLTVPFIKFLAPSLVQVIVDDTEIHRSEWTERLKNLGIDASQYLWDRCPTLFPGVRRKIGNKEVKIPKTAPIGSGSRSTDAIAIDDNHYPKQVWAFVFLGTKFKNLGPTGYSQAHIFDHKVYGNRMNLELLPGVEGQAPILSCHGLFTSVANTVFLPTGLMRPTDFPGPLRNLLQRKAESLYGQCCNLLPEDRFVKPSNDDRWSIDSFSWSDPVGRNDFVPEFLTYRSTTIEDLLKMREKEEQTRMSSQRT